jgi:hypothetical protein
MRLRVPCFILMPGSCSHFGLVRGVMGAKWEQLRGAGTALMPASLVTISVDARLAVDLAAQLHVDRHAQHLPVDVPERHLDGADGREDDRAAALGPERVIVHL